MNLNSTLNQTKLQTDNNPLYQLLKQILVLLQNASQPVSSSNVVVMEVDTSTGPVTVHLNLIGTSKTVVKDVTGNAAANNITISGTVDGVVNPVINTNFGAFRVYSSKLGFRGW